MKILLTALLTLAIIAGYAQAKKPLKYNFDGSLKDTTKTIIDWHSDTKINIGYMADSSSVWLSADNKVTSITGDTIQVIEYLVSLLHHRDSIIDQYYLFMDAAVGFSNCVPNGYKQNTPWFKYYALLKKNGYTISPKKISISDCCK